MSTVETVMRQLAEYASGAASNWRAANAADEIAALVLKAGLGNCSIDLAWHAGGGATIACAGRLDKEADVRRIFHEVAERHGLKLEEPRRTDSLAVYGTVQVDYGSLKLTLMPDGTHCRRVQVGTKSVPAREEPVWEIVCGEPEQSEAKP